MSAALLMLLACVVLVFTIIPLHDVQSIEQFFNILITYVWGVACIVAVIAIVGIYLFVWIENRKDAKEEEEISKLAGRE